MLTPTVSAALFPPPPATLWRRLSDAVCDTVFPPHCASCHAPVEPPRNAALCRKCADAVRWIGADRCARCGEGAGAGAGVRPDCPACRSHPPAYVEGACALGKFDEGPLRDVVLALKFGRRTHLAGPLGHLLAARIRDTGLLDGADRAILVPVPLVRAPVFQAAWNHAESIAESIAGKLRLPVVAGLVRKIRATPPQATLKRMERRVNLKGAFACDAVLAKRHAGATVLLIDDVITTGSTISECARTLVSAGFSTIRAAAVARA